MTKPATDLRPDDVLAWIDVESSSLNPWVADDGTAQRGGHLLEVACILSDPLGNLLLDGEHFESVVHHTESEVAQMRASADPIVDEMHTTSGLWNRVLDGQPRETVDEGLSAFIQRAAPRKRQARVAGNSVRLDLNFSEAELPLTYSRVHYRSVDVTSVSYALRSHGVVPHPLSKARAHEALSDIRESIAEYKWSMSFALKGLRAVKEMERLGLEIPT